MAWANLPCGRELPDVLPIAMEKESDTMPAPVEEVLRSFLEGDRPQRPELDTIVLVGSQATGRATPASDVDLVYLGRFTRYVRENIPFQDRGFDLVIIPWRMAHALIADHHWRNFLTAILAQGIPLDGDGPEWQVLHAAAQDHYVHGPNPASSQEIRQFRVSLTELWDDYQDLSGLPRRWLATELAREGVDAHYALKRWWRVKPKYLWQDLAQRDGSAAGKLEALLARPEEPAAAQALLTYVLRPVGGFMRDGWRVVSDVPP
jgi:hypothetical protein